MGNFLFGYYNSNLASVLPDGISLEQTAHCDAGSPYRLCVQVELFGMDKPFADNVLTPIPSYSSGGK